MLRNFGIKRNVRSVNQVIKNIDEEDQKTIDSIFEKYGKTQNKHFYTYSVFVINAIANTLLFTRKLKRRNIKDVRGI